MRTRTYVRHLIDLAEDEQFNHDGPTGLFRCRQVEVSPSVATPGLISIILTGQMVKKDGTLGYQNRYSHIKQVTDLPQAVRDAIKALPVLDQGCIEPGCGKPALRLCGDHLLFGAPVPGETDEERKMRESEGR